MNDKQHNIIIGYIISGESRFKGTECEQNRMDFTPLRSGRKPMNWVHVTVRLNAVAALHGVMAAISNNKVSLVLNAVAPS